MQLNRRQFVAFHRRSFARDRCPGGGHTDRSRSRRTGRGRRSDDRGYKASHSHQECGFSGTGLRDRYSDTRQNGNRYRGRPRRDGDPAIERRNRSVASGSGRELRLWLVASGVARGGCRSSGARNCAGADERFAGAAGAWSHSRRKWRASRPWPQSLA